LEYQYENFWGYNKRLEENYGHTFRGNIKREKIEGILILIFLAIGMGLQGIAVIL
jgi:hypothetical protein